jgi:hypothetical protein
MINIYYDTSICCSLEFEAYYLALIVLNSGCHLFVGARFKVDIIVIMLTERYSVLLTAFVVSVNMLRILLNLSVDEIALLNGFQTVQVRLNNYLFLIEQCAS